MISGIWLLVIFASLLLVLGTYERACDTAICCEAAVYGGTEAVKRTGDGLQMAQKRLESFEKTYQVSGSKREITVTFANDVKIPFAGLIWKWKGMIKSKVVRPVLFIEKIQKARRFREDRTD